MRSDFVCGACSLHFTVGWSDDPPLAEGYGAKAHLVCGACGTEYRIEVAIRDRGPSLERLFDVALVAIDESQQSEAVDIFRTRFDMTAEDAAEVVEMLPMEVARSVHAQLADELNRALSAVGTVRVTEVASTPSLRHGPPRRDRFLSGGAPRFGVEQRFEEIDPEGSRLGPNGEFDLDAQTCAACGARGSLLGNPLEIGEVCPHCGERSVECTEEWET